MTHSSDQASRMAKHALVPGVRPLHDPDLQKPRAIQVLSCLSRWATNASNVPPTWTRRWAFSTRKGARQHIKAVARPLTIRPTATVVIPHYNYGQYLPMAVGSCLAQPGIDVEIIIVDDCSTDGSEAVAKTLAKKHEQVRLIQNPVNRRHIATYNTGLMEATGDYVALLSADDMLAPGSLTRACALMEANPSVGLTYGAIQIFSNTPPMQAGHSDIIWVLWGGEEWAEEVFRSGRNALYSPEAVARTSVMQQTGFYDPEHPHAGDLQMWLRLAAVSNVGFVSGVTQAFYRQHTTNMHSQVFQADQAAGMVTELQERERVFASQIGAFRAGERMLQHCHEALACEAVDLAARAYVWGLTETWPVDALLAFARSCDPDVEATSAWRAYRRRALVGTRWAQKNPAFVPREYVLRHMERKRELRHRQIGVRR
jgi:hypothetical protein